MNDYEQTNIGTEIKIAVTLECGGVSMDDMDFFVDFFTTSSHTLRIEKSKMRRDSENAYIAVIDTSSMSSGVIKMRVTAEIPDSDCDDGWRREIMTTTTNVSIRR